MIHGGKRRQGEWQAHTLRQPTLQVGNMGCFAPDKAITTTVQKAYQRHVGVLGLFDDGLRCHPTSSLQAVCSGVASALSFVPSELPESHCCRHNTPEAQ